MSPSFDDHILVGVFFMITTLLNQCYMHMSLQIENNNVEKIENYDLNYNINWKTLLSNPNTLVI